MPGLVQNGDIWEHIPSKDPTIYQVQPMFEQTALKRTTWKKYSKDIELFKDYIGRDRKPRTIFREDIAKFKEWLGLTKGMNPNSISSVCGTLKTFFRWCEFYGIIEPRSSPFEPVPPTFEYVKGNRRYI